MKKTSYAPEILAIGASLFGAWFMAVSSKGLSYGVILMLGILAVSFAKLSAKVKRNRGK
jgi:hypothetical protein